MDASKSQDIQNWVTSLSPAYSPIASNSDSETTRNSDIRDFVSKIHLCADLNTSLSSSTSTHVAEDNGQRFSPTSFDETNEVIKRKMEIREELVDFEQIIKTIRNNQECQNFCDSGTVDGTELEQSNTDGLPIDQEFSSFAANFERRLRCRRHRYVLQTTLNDKFNNFCDIIPRSFAALNTDENSAVLLNLMIEIVEKVLCEAQEDEDYGKFEQFANIRMYLITDLADVVSRKEEYLQSSTTANDFDVELEECIYSEIFNDRSLWSRIDFWK